jgi:hypothetical protein
MLRLQDIRIRDPFVLPDPDSGRYVLFGTTSRNPWGGPAEGFECYVSTDLVHWDGPVVAFLRPDDFWADTQFWAPEVHRYGGAYYLFASFKSAGRFRGTQILRAHQAVGPYSIWSPEPVTPPHWECLDGTLWVEPDGVPWMVFCHEWVQVHDGGMWAVPLRDDLHEAAGRPLFLFNASEAPWVRRAPWPGETDHLRFPTYVTDGPWLHRTGSGALLLLWSSQTGRGYAIGQAVSESGRVTGPWHHLENPLWDGQGGHGMLFRTFEGALHLALHRPNRTPDERAVFIPVCEDGCSIRIRTI